MLLGPTSRHWSVRGTEKPVFIFRNFLVTCWWDVECQNWRDVVSCCSWTCSTCFMYFPITEKFVFFVVVTYHRTMKVKVFTGINPLLFNVTQFYLFVWDNKKENWAMDMCRESYCTCWNRQRTNHLQELDMWVEIQQHWLQQTRREGLMDSI